MLGKRKNRRFAVLLVLLLAEQLGTPLFITTSVEYVGGQKVVTVHSPAKLVNKTGAPLQVGTDKSFIEIPQGQSRYYPVPGYALYVTFVSADYLISYLQIRGEAFRIRPSKEIEWSAPRRLSGVSENVEDVFCGKRHYVEQVSRGTSTHL